MILQQLVGLGHTVVVIEHQLDVIAAADWVIDLGPDGGDAGGRIVAMGPPGEIARTDESLTGKALRPLVARADMKFSQNRSATHRCDLGWIATECTFVARACIAVTRSCAVDPRLAQAADHRDLADRPNLL